MVLLVVCKICLAFQCLLYLVVVAVLRRTANEVANKSGEEELGANHHHRKRDVEVGRIGYKALRYALRQAPKLVYTQGKAEMKPMKNISVPRKPNTCIGFLPKLERNHSVMRSR